VDLLKYDNCNDAGRPARTRFEVMAKALSATGRNFIYSVCEWGDSSPWTWAHAVGAHSWRTYGDISDNWQSFVSIVDRQVGLVSYSGPGGWNDPDMLEVGNGGMTSEEYRAQMSLWALLNAPLIAGNDLRSMSAETRRILTNPAVIAVDQDWSGSQGRRIAVSGLSEVWAKPVKGGGVALVLFNRDGHDVRITASATSIGLPQSSVFGVRDLWTDERRMSSADISGLVPSHGVKMLAVSPP
jgi:alpha-galactosidase